MDHIRYFERGNTQVPVQMYKEIILQLVVYRRKDIGNSTVVYMYETPFYQSSRAVRCFLSVN